MNFAPYQDPLDPKTQTVFQYLNTHIFKQYDLKEKLKIDSLYIAIALAICLEIGLIGFAFFNSTILPLASVLIFYRLAMAILFMLFFFENGFIGIDFLASIVSPFSTMLHVITEHFDFQKKLDNYLLTLLPTLQKAYGFLKSFKDCPSTLSYKEYRNLIKVIYAFYEYRHANNVFLDDTRMNNQLDANIAGENIHGNAYSNFVLENLHLGFIRYLEENHYFTTIQTLVKMGAESADFPKFHKLQNNKMLGQMLEELTRSTSNPGAFKHILNTYLEIKKLPENTIDNQGSFSTLCEQAFTHSWESGKKIRDIKNTPAAEGLVARARQFLGL